MHIPRLPDAELMIMNIIWRCQDEVTSAQVTNMLENHKGWTASTILTLLARLAERGFLTVRKDGRHNVYRAAIAEADYVESESKTFLEKFHGNSLTSLVASLYSGRAIGEDDLAELRRFIDEK